MIGGESMFKKMGLKGQVLIPVCGVTSIILIGLVIGLLVKDMELAEEKAVELAHEIGTKYSLVIKSDLDDAMISAQNTAYTFQSLQSHKQKLKRTEYTDIIKSVFMRHSNFFGMGSAWEPNALDGKDEEYKNTPNHDGTGRYIPYWVREGGNLTLHAGADYEEEKNADFYHVPRRTKKEIITEPYEYTVGDKKVFMTTLTAPILNNRDHSFMGVMAVDVSLEQIQKLVSKINLFHTGYAYLISNKGTFVSHPNAEMIGKSFVGRVKKDQKEAIAHAISKGETYKFFWTHPNGTKYIQVLTPVQIGQTTTPWSLGIGVPLHEITQDSRDMAKVAFMFAILATLVVSGFIYYIITQILERINLSVALAQKISKGNLDHTFDIKGSNELTMLALALKNMLDALRKKELAAKTIAKGDLTEEIELASEEDELGKSLQAMQSSLTGMLKTIQQNSTGLSESLTELSAISSQMSNATTEMSSQSNTVAGASEEMSAGIRTLSSSNSEMNANIQSIAATSTQVSQNMDEISGGIDYLSGAIKQVSDKSASAQDVAKQAIEISTLSTEKMNDLDQSASKIGEFSQIIKEIAQQTNLLALNANIEAASAGEAGKGFAVVANEIKELATQSSRSAEDISVTIAEIQSNTENSVSSMKDVAGIIANIDRSTTEILELSQRGAENVTQMVTHVKESTVGVEEVSKLINEISVVTESTAQTSEEFSSTIDDISKNMQELDRVVSETASGVSQVHSETNTISRIAENLHQVIGKFKL